ncbi:alpha/beta hydrolase [Pseudonocardia sp.]|jgi:acetyl esterase/lipase|uniref:alpha/beta hydrolase n=1 Tax=Pseudonocardia sp. TaxID=60912 RepID=UPI0031FD25B0
MAGDVTPEFEPVVLEPAAQAIAEATANPPYAYDLGPAGYRDRMAQIQSGDIAAPEASIEDISIPVGDPPCRLPVRIVRPKGVTGILPVIVHLHGGGWMSGTAHTHDRLIRELAIGAGAAVVFPEYTLSPEAKYPTALEECYAVAAWVARHGADQNLDPHRIAISGDSAGGNLAAAVTLLAKRRGGPRFVRQVLFYPVLDANFDTASYQSFAEGYFLRRDVMRWYWDLYIERGEQRTEITASPLRAGVEALAGLPPALIITAEVDVLRDEGEAYARKLRHAGVPATAVRYQGTIHAFVMFNSLYATQATQAAVAQASAVLHQSFHR